ncbi:hypothetical protein IID21_00785 [Patescibacteria group bacterium]|nr:hypothetical protein [Patescibacteria group bacterium]
MRKSKGLLFLAASTAFILLSAILIGRSSGSVRQAAASFAECVKLPGSVIQESYPEVCVTKNGERFTRELTEEEKFELNLDEDIDTEVSCGLYKRFGKEITACAVCGNGLCEPYESCTASTITEEFTTNDCGPLYCPQDCGEEVN